MRRLAAAAALATLSCAAAQPVAKDLVCSPNADAWHAVQLHKQCPEQTTAECLAAAELKEEYIRRATKECENHG